MIYVVSFFLAVIASRASQSCQPEDGPMRNTLQSEFVLCVALGMPMMLWIALLVL
jgi:hypothetical protein